MCHGKTFSCSTHLTLPDFDWDFLRWRSGSIRVAWPKGQGASHFLSLFPIPYSLLPAPCSLKPKTFYLTQFKTAIVQSTLHQNQPQSI
ncbi:MAG: hypothetical protein F6K26_35265 [Moorea sp. SIO2I5]|nr:hypothetical protein [Moorena sp. SIO2I5]